MIDKSKLITLYKALLKESLRFENYSFKNFFFKRVKEIFKSKIQLNDEKMILENYEKNLDLLNVLKRQTAISKLYPSEKLIVEKL